MYQSFLEYIRAMKQLLSTGLEIRHSNVLTNARSEYSAIQLDLFFFILYNLRKPAAGVEVPHDSLVYQLDIKDLSVLTGNRYNLPNLVEATEGMISRVFSAKTEKGPGQFAMLQSAVYLTGTRVIEIELTRLVLPHLFDLKDNFTSYALAAALRLTSKFAKRIYQICSQWKDLGETKKYDIQDLKAMLGLIDDHGNEKLKVFADFRRTVLDVAVKQINEHTELHISYKLEKSGRSFKKISFIVKSQALAHTIPFDLEPTTPTLPGVQQHQYERAVKILDEFRMGAKFRQIILASPDYVMKTNLFRNDMQRDFIKVKSNAAGLLLSHLGLFEPKQKPA